MKKPRFAPRPALLKQIVDRSNYSIHPRSKTRMVSNRFWHIVSVVKERTPLSSRKALPKPIEYRKVPASCQPRFTPFFRVFHSLPQIFLPSLSTKPPASCKQAHGSPLPTQEIAPHNFLSPPLLSSFSFPLSPLSENLFEKTGMATCSHPVRSIPKPEAFLKRDVFSFLRAVVCLLFVANPAKAQNPDIKFISDTLVIQAEGLYEDGSRFGDTDL